MAVAVTVFKALASVTSLVMLLSPALGMYRIHKAKSVGVASFFPLATLLANSHVWLLYGYFSNLIFPLVVTFVAGDVIALVYIAIYWRYTTERPKVLRMFLTVVVVMSAFTVFGVFAKLGYTGQSEKSLENTYGIIADVVSLCLYAAPMEKVYMVLKHKSAAYFQVHMVIAGLTNNSTWFIYGILTNNWFIIGPDILYISIGSVSLALCIVYNPKTHPLVLEDDVNKADIDMSVSIAITPTCADTKGATGLQSPSFVALQSPVQGQKV